ncbi:MAG: hypothetical protein ACXQTC_06305 [Methanopyraceae archaeon]
MRAALLLAAVLMAAVTTGVSAAEEYPVTGEVVGSFKVKITKAEPVDAQKYAVVIGDRYVNLIMVEKRDLQGSGPFKTQPFLLPIPKDKVSVKGTQVTFPGDLVGRVIPAYCLNPMGRHPIGEMVVPTWEEIKDRFVQVKVVTVTGPKVEKRFLRPDWVQRVVRRVEVVVNPDRWSRRAQVIVWVTEASVPQEVSVRARVSLDVQATVRANTSAFFQLNRSELQRLAESGGEVAKELLNFFSNQENMNLMMSEAQAALDFVRQYLSDVVTAVQVAGKVEAYGKAYGKLPVSVLALVALVLPARVRRG